MGVCSKCECDEDEEGMKWVFCTGWEFKDGVDTDEVVGVLITGDGTSSAKMTKSCSSAGTP